MMLNYIKNVLENLPADWLKLTTHRLDIYEEKLAKTQFLEQFENLYKQNKYETSALAELPTAFDYIRLGHPLSSILEWGIAHLNGLKASEVISFSSKTTPILAVLRKNLFEKKDTLLLYSEDLPESFYPELLRKVYGYNFELKKLEAGEPIPAFEGTTVLISQADEFAQFELPEAVDFFIASYNSLGSLILVNEANHKHYVSEIQHVRRRESIAMTPADSLTALESMIGKSKVVDSVIDWEGNKLAVRDCIREVTGTSVPAQIGSSGLSVQYAIMMGLIGDALVNHKGKAVKFIIPPNCYGGTNDQARRVAACLDYVEVLDLPVDREHNMETSIDQVLEQVAKEDAVPFIIVEIPTNPRVEVPNLIKLEEALTKVRRTPSGTLAVDPVFILDQTFCPNVRFLGAEDLLSNVRAISYVSGSKFPSGGRCTAGYCVANEKAKALMSQIERQIKLCDNEATGLQLEILADQMPSMNQRIVAAYKNTREFVSFIEECLPEAKINFVSEELAEQGFTPSVFSLDLPTKGSTEAEREAYKRKLNEKLIEMMITEIPKEGKYCVSYGQLKGCYWTIPATSTQGTTKEDDKDYIARVSLSPDLDLEKHKAVFADFVEQIQ